jgi:hypothetical protein
MKRIGALAILLVALTGCVASQSQTTTNVKATAPPNAVVVLMKPDVQLGVLKASGVIEPRADWTEEGKRSMSRALDQALAAKGKQLRLVSDDVVLSEREQQLVHLHQAVGATILTFRQGMLRLPTKKDTFDWSLGPGAKDIASRFGADYALFVYAKGAYADAGRVATMVVFAALGVGVPLGGQVVFASLVDLHNGDVVWFGVAQTGESNEIRNDGGAAAVVKSLTKDLPL